MNMETLAVSETEANRISSQVSERSIDFSEASNSPEQETNTFPQEVQPKLDDIHDSFDLNDSLDIFSDDGRQGQTEQKKSDDSSIDFSSPSDNEAANDDDDSQILNKLIGNNKLKDDYKEYSDSGADSDEYDSDGNRKHPSRRNKKALSDEGEFDVDEEKRKLNARSALWKSKNKFTKKSKAKSSKESKKSSKSRSKSNSTRETADDDNSTSSAGDNSGNRSSSRSDSSSDDSAESDKEEEEEEEGDRSAKKKSDSKRSKKSTAGAAAGASAAPKAVEIKKATVVETEIEVKSNFLPCFF